MKPIYSQFYLPNYLILDNLYNALVEVDSYCSLHHYDHEWSNLGGIKIARIPKFSTLLFVPRPCPYVFCH